LMFSFDDTYEHLKIKGLKNIIFQINQG